MTIRSLLSLLESKQLIEERSLSELAGTRIGIDALFWLKSLQIDEPLQVAMGGLPNTLENLVKNELEKWKRVNIKPLFVFDGLYPLPTRKYQDNRMHKKQEQDHPGLHYLHYYRSVLASAQKKKTSRVDGWDSYANKKIDEATKQFQAAERYTASNFAQHVMLLLSQENQFAEVFRAPYLAWAQLAYFLLGEQSPCNQTVRAQGQVVSNIFGDLESLLFGAPRVIISINFENNTYRTVEGSSLIHAIQATSEQFIDASILSGFECCQTFSFVLETRGLNFFANAIELVKSNYSGVAAIQFAQMKTGPKGNYMDTFLRTKCLVQHLPVLDAACHCRQIAPNQAPADLQEVVGPKLPNKIYYLLSQGVVQPKILECLSRGYLVENIPLINSIEYWDLVAKFSKIRELTVALGTAYLHPSLAERTVIVSKVHETSNDYKLDHASQHNYIKSLSYYVNNATLQTEQAKQNCPTINLGFIVNMLNAKAISAEEGTLSSPKAVESSIYLQALTLLGFASNDWKANGLTAALGKVTPCWQEPALALLVMLQNGALHGNKLTFQDKFVDDYPLENTEEICLLTRVFSAIPMRLKTMSWNGPLNHDLTAFNSLLKASYNALRDLFEMIALNIFVSDKATINACNYQSISARLPFLQESNSALGITLKAHLLNNANPKEFGELYDCCENPTEDILKGQQFWNEIVEMIKSLHSSGCINEETLNSFLAADQFLAERKI